MKPSNANTITEVTRRAIFKAMRRERFEWWGDSDEADLLAQVFDLESMESTDYRQENAYGDISLHRGHHRDWEDDWIFDDNRLDLIHCPDATLLRLFAMMSHPTTQPERKKVKWLVDLLNLHLAPDGWQLEKVSTISGRPIYEGRHRDPDSLPDSSRYLVPDDVDVDLESSLYTISRVFAHQGKMAEVAILADAAAELTQTHYDNWDGGTYGYTLYLRIPPALYAQVADERSEFANRIREAVDQLLSQGRDLHAVVIQPFQKAPEGWQGKARAFVSGQGVTNQGRVRSTNIAGREHDGLLFRSQAEVNLYDALKKRGVAFAPLPVFLHGGEEYKRIEPDFVIIKDGVFAVVEVDGDSFHPETPSAAQKRLKLLDDAGAYIKRVNANSCRTPESAEACADEILNYMDKQKHNRR
ncbi:MAG: hypothetical protein P4L85_29150 [Paludisphaera borealis]|uniref:AbiJ-related protein n=1 Tax=Paludisphaera borealis TaxID=1387353 RepID=UPI00284440F5|nr:hypothetical protein [Paludisphaera borealis]MDR3623436.1 hypothetical protein [Paludisphaera borealis]